MHYIDYAVIAAYMLAVVGIGFYFSRNEKSSEDYLLGGRNMPYLAIGLSCMMSLTSSISIVMIPGEIFRNGLTLFIGGFLSILLIIPCFLVFTRFYFKLGSFTPYEYLEFRYDRNVRTLVACTSLYLRISYLGMVLYTTSKIFEGAYGWEYWQTILLVGIIGIAYTVMGGMKAVVWTDVLQFFVLALGFIVIVAVLCGNIEGGAWGAVSYAFEHGRGVPQFSTADFYKVSPYVRLTFWMLLLGIITSVISDATTDQITIQRLLSTKDWKAGLKSQVTNALTGLPFSLALWFVGLALFTYYTQHPDPGLKDADGALFRFISTKLPSPMGGVFMAAMLAAIMSTLDSGMNSMATIWLKEVHQRYINKNLSNQQQVSVSRWATFIVGIIAISMALLLGFSGRWLTQSAAEIGTLFYILGAVNVPAFVLAVFSSRVRPSLIWLLVFFSIGYSISTKLWYGLSRSALQSWTEGAPLSWAGPLSYGYVITPLLAALLLAGTWILFKELRRNKFVITLGLAGTFAFGFAVGMLVWALYSNTLIEASPLARSFNFNLPIVWLFAFVGLCFFPKRPREEYQGLTIFTVNQPILKQKEDSPGE
jgi:SSS family transporter